MRYQACKWPQFFLHEYECRQSFEVHLSILNAFSSNAIQFFLLSLISPLACCRNYLSKNTLSSKFIRRFQSNHQFPAKFASFPTYKLLLMKFQLTDFIKIFRICSAHVNVCFTREKKILVSRQTIVYSPKTNNMLTKLRHNLLNGNNKNTLSTRSHKIDDINSLVQLVLLRKGIPLFSSRNPLRRVATLNQLS